MFPKLPINARKKILGLEKSGKCINDIWLFLHPSCVIGGAASDHFGKIPIFELFHSYFKVPNKIQSVWFYDKRCDFCSTEG